MARHIPSKQIVQDSKSTDVGTSDVAPVPGGSLGVASRAAGIHKAGSAKSPLDQTPSKPPTRYRVTGGPSRQPGRVSVMYDGARSEWALGKEVTELTHDLNLLRRQGIKLEEVKDDAEEPGLAEGVPPIPAAQIDDAV